MIINSIIVSTVIGISIGILYGFSFLAMEKKTRSSSGNKLFASVVIASGIRLICLAVILIFLLRAPMINSMLMVLNILITFWAYIITQQRSNEKT